jgi:hypothetical protein
MRRRMDVTEDAKRAVDKTIEELLALGETNRDHLSFRVRMEWGPGGALIAHLEPKTQAGASLLTGAVARASAA